MPTVGTPPRKYFLKSDIDAIAEESRNIVTGTRSYRLRAVRQLPAERPSLSDIMIVSDWTANSIVLDIAFEFSPARTRLQGLGM